MKKWQRWVIIAGAALGLSACFQVHSQAKFKSDGSAAFKSTIDMSALYAMTKEMGVPTTDDQKFNCAEAKKDLPAGFTCKDIKEGVIEYGGDLAAGSVKGLKRDGMTWSLDVLEFFKGMNKAAEMPLGDKNEKLDASKLAMLRNMGMALDLDLQVPGSIVSVDGKPHTGESGHVKIDLLESLTKDHYVVVVRVIPTWMIVAAIGAGIVLVGGLLMVLVRRRKA